MRLLEVFNFLAVPVILTAQCDQGTPGAPSFGGKEIYFDYDLEVEFELLGPSGQNMDVIDLLGDLFDGQIFEVELQLDGVGMTR